MKALYWDTSCVLALYVPERISTKASELASEEKGPIQSSAILEFEMTLAVHAKEARGELMCMENAKGGNAVPISL